MNAPALAPVDVELVDVQHDDPAPDVLLVNVEPEAPPAERRTKSPKAKGDSDPAPELPVMTLDEALNDPEPLIAAQARSERDYEAGVKKKPACYPNMVAAWQHNRAVITWNRHGSRGTAPVSPRPIPTKDLPEPEMD